MCTLNLQQRQCSYFVKFCWTSALRFLNNFRYCMQLSVSSPKFIISLFAGSNRLPYALQTRVYDMIFPFIIRLSSWCMWFTDENVNDILQHLPANHEQELRRIHRITYTKMTIVRKNSTIASMGRNIYPGYTPYIGYTSVYPIGTQSNIFYRRIYTKPFIYIRIYTECWQKIEMLSILISIKL